MLSLIGVVLYMIVSAALMLTLFTLGSWWLGRQDQKDEKELMRMADTINTPVTDVDIYNQGSIWQFFPHTDTAREWIAEHVPDIPDYMRLAPDGAFNADWRMGRDIAHGMQYGGLIVEYR